MRSAILYTIILLMMSQIAPAFAATGCEGDMEATLKVQLAAAEEELAKPEEARREKDPRLFVNLRNPETNPVTLKLKAKIEKLRAQIAHEEELEALRVRVLQLAPALLGREIQTPAATVLAALLQIEAVDPSALLLRFKEIEGLAGAQDLRLLDPELALLTVMAQKFDRSPTEVVDLFLKIRKSPLVLQVNDITDMKVCILTLAALRHQLTERDISRRFVKETLRQSFDPFDESASAQKWDPSSPHFMMGATLDFVTGSGGLGDDVGGFGFDNASGYGSGSDSTNSSGGFH